MTEKNKLIYIIFVFVLGCIGVISIPVSMKLYGWVGLCIPLFLCIILAICKIVFEKKDIKK